MTTTPLLLDRLETLRSEQQFLLQHIDKLSKSSEINYVYNDRNNDKRARDIKSVKSITYTLDLARSGLILIERILKEMKGIIEKKIENNNSIYTIQLDLLKAELNCIKKLFVYNQIEIFTDVGWEWDIGCSNYKWYYDLTTHINNIDYTNNGPQKIDIITANIAKSYIDIDSILLNVNINNSAILDVEESNRVEVVDQVLYERLNKITTEIDVIIKCILEKV